MPFEIIWENRGSLWIYTGYVSGDELVASNETFLNDERSDRARYQIIDMSQITGVEDSPATMKMLAASDFGAGTYLRNMRVALVATLPTMRALISEYQRLLNSLNCRWETRLFDNVEEARAWALASLPRRQWDAPSS